MIASGSVLKGNCSLDYYLITYVYSLAACILSIMIMIITKD